MLMKAVQISAPGAGFELVTREIPKPGENDVLIRVEACGICHGDAIVKEGHFPWIQYPRIPGHEVIGTVSETGARAGNWKKGQRVGVGWYGGYCLECTACFSGNFEECENTLTTGISTDGGYAEYMTAHSEALVAIPQDLDSVEGAPLICAGRTTFGALRGSIARAGDLVAIQGLGGLGHIAVQFANRMGFKTVAVSRGKDKEALAYRLGARIYIDSTASDAAAELKKMGGARVILGTAPSGKSISGIFGGLARGGQLIIVAAPRDTIQIHPGMLFGGGTLGGSVGGSIEEALNFSVLTKVTPMVEVFPLEKAAEAYEKMMSSKVLFRSVLKISS
jgi:D-arabinose 1-dehydrogenase-like Zn-dependent alcohol dehydrogenase